MRAERPPLNQTGNRVDSSSGAVEFFDAIAEDYDAKHYGEAVRSFMTIRQTRVLELVDDLHLREGADVLDAGCGPGYLVDALARRGFRVQALDAAEAMLKSASSRLSAIDSRFPVSFRQGDIEHLPYDDQSFDLVCSTGVIEYLADDEKVLAEMFRVLRPGGYLVLPVTNLWAPANWLEFLIERLKRQPWFLRPLNALLGRFGRLPVMPRYFRVRFHRPSRFRASLAQAGFVLKDELFFHFMPWPRPLDRVIPGTDAIGRWLEQFGRSHVGRAGEGYLTLSRRPDAPTH